MVVDVTSAAGERVAHLYGGKGRRRVEVRMEVGVTGAAGEREWHTCIEVEGVGEGRGGRGQVGGGCYWCGWRESGTPV